MAKYVTADHIHTLVQGEDTMDEGGAPGGWISQRGRRRRRRRREAGRQGRRSQWWVNRLKGLKLRGLKLRDLKLRGLNVLKGLKC